MHYLFLFFLCYSCWACDAPAPAPSSAVVTTAEVEPTTLRAVTPSNPVVDVPEVQEQEEPATIDSVEVPTFRVVLQASATAKKLLATGEENFILSVVLMGTPKDAKSLAAKDYYNTYDEVIYLLNKRYTITDPTQEFVLQENISKEALEALETGDYKVIIDGFGARKSSPDNVFHTKMVSGPISTFQGKTHVLTVKIL